MYKFQPILKSTIWGGEKIVPYKHIASDQKQVGESWELSGVKGSESVVAGGPEAGTTLPGLIARHGAALLGKANAERFGQEFPLLIKFIDARQDLSIQVHPNDALAWERHKSKGKTEMWYVVDADEGARLRSGFAKQVTPAQYEASVEDNTITDLLAEYEIHPGDLQARVVRMGSRYTLSCLPGEKVSGHRPSVDALFSSMASAVKCPMVGIIMTGMGRDGADGLLQMRRAGAYTIGQDKDSCVVYGMPMVAYDIGAVAVQASCENIAGVLMAHLKGDK